MAAAAAAREAAERERRAAMEAAARERMEKQHHADLGKLERLKEVERVSRPIHNIKVYVGSRAWFEVVL